MNYLMEAPEKQREDIENLIATKLKRDFKNFSDGTKRKFSSVSN